MISMNNIIIHQSVEILTKLALDSSSTIAIAFIVVVLTSLIVLYRWMKSIGKPTNLKLSDVKYDSVTLEWTKPEQGGKHVISYTIYCRISDDPTNQWQSKMTTNEEKAIVANLSPRTCYFFKVRPECGFRHGKESDVTDLIKTKPKYPGKPNHKPAATQITQDSICLRWGEPEFGADLVIKSSIFYRSTKGGQNQWKIVVVEGNICTKIINLLKPETKYIFKVCPESEFGSGTESDLSDEIKTDKVLSERIKEISRRLSGTSSPELYHVNMKICVGGIRYVIGEPLSNQAEEKVLILVGATGAGKTTLLNGIVNYIFGVQLVDNFRFRIDVKTESDVNPARSDQQSYQQTSKVTAYTFYPMDGSCLSYPVTIIDTPGFGDTRGDKTVLRQILEIISTEGGDSIKHFNGVGVVMQASSLCLTPTQQHIFDSMLNVFGKNVASNMFLMITYADCQDPPAISAVKKARISYRGFYKFNNSTLFNFTKPATQGSFTQLYWDLGKESFDRFFNVLRKIEPVSVELTKQVLIERQHLELVIEGLQRNINSGLDKINALRIEEILLRVKEEEMKINENFTYKVTITEQKRVDLPKEFDRRALNCRNCLTTCHFPCERKDDDIYNCVVMDSCDPNVARCTICPFTCTWNMHILQGFHYRFIKQVETRTMKTLKARYDKAKGHHEKAKSTVTILEEELSQVQQDVMIKIKKGRKYKERLNEIALNPETLTEVKYIDNLISAEINIASEGCDMRVEALQELRLAAKLLSEEDNIPPKEFSIDWWTSFRSNVQGPTPDVHSSVDNDKLKDPGTKQPTLQDLSVLKYNDKGEKRKLHIMDEAQHKWKDITDLIFAESNKATTFESKCPGDSKACLRLAFIEGFIENSPEKYSQDWNGLIELLDDVRLKALAEKIKYVLWNCL